MESKPKSDNVKSKRSNRKFSASTVNSISKERGKSVQKKLILKRRGLYVERNPGKLEINEVFVEKSSSKSSQHDYPSTILTSSTVGNQNSLTHEVIKSKKRVRKSSLIIKENTKDENKNDLIKSKENNFKASKEESKDGIVYVLQSRTKRGRSITTTESYKSKQTNEYDIDNSAVSFQRSRSHIDNNPSGSFDSGIDRIAAQILQGWMMRKEKGAKLEDLKNPDVSDKNENLYSLSLNLAAAAGNKIENLRELPSCSKNAHPIDIVPEIDGKRITFDVSDHTDISTPRFDMSRKFVVMENDYRFNKEPIFNRPVIKTKLRPKVNKFRSELRSVNDSNKTTNKMKRNAKKEFMTIIKRELKRNERIPEEPRSMFDALKVVARNKRFSKRRVCLDLSDTDCELNSSKLIVTAKRHLNRLKSRSLNYPFNSQPKIRRHRRGLRTDPFKQKCKN